MDPLFERSERLANLLFENDIVGSLRACERARVNPAVVRPVSTTTDHFRGPWDPASTTRFRMEKLTFIATYCIRNGITHRLEDGSYATVYDSEGDHYYRYDPSAGKPYWSTATALVLPIIANYSEVPGGPRIERPLVVKIIVLKWPAPAVWAMLKDMNLSFGASNPADPYEFALECAILEHLERTNTDMPDNEHCLKFPRMYAYGARDLTERVNTKGARELFSMASIVMSRAQGRSLADVCTDIERETNYTTRTARINAVGRLLAYAIPDMSGLPDWQAHAGAKEYGHFKMIHNDLHFGNYLIDEARGKINVIDFARAVFVLTDDSPPVRNKLMVTLDPRNPLESIIIEFSIIRDYVMMFMYTTTMDPLNQQPKSVMSRIIRTALLASANILYKRIQTFLRHNIQTLFAPYEKMRTNLTNAQTELRTIGEFVNSAHPVRQTVPSASIQKIVENMAFYLIEIRKFKKQAQEHAMQKRYQDRGASVGAGNAYVDRTDRTDRSRSPDRRKRSPTRRRSPERSPTRRRSPERSPTRRPVPAPVPTPAPTQEDVIDLTED